MNPFFQAMGGNRQPNMMQQFQSFMQQMRGKEPHPNKQEMVSTGRITQDQHNHLQKTAQVDAAVSFLHAADAGHRP